MVVKRHFLTHVVPGMVLAKAIQTENQILIPEGTILTEDHIQLLRSSGFAKIEILEVQIDQVESLPVEFTIAYQQIVQAVRQLFMQVRYFQMFRLKDFKQILDWWAEPVLHSARLLNYLNWVSREEDYVFRHSANVAIINGLLGKWMGLHPFVQQELVLTGLLHDIGKAQIPLEILNKPGRLEEKEMELMKSHAEAGFDLLNRTNGISSDVLLGVAQHHERIDGSGYPLGLPAVNIHLYAKITAVADCYDAMTSDRSYYKRRTPFSVMEVLHTEMFSKLDPTVCSVFMSRAKNLFIGAMVLLSDGRQAEVVLLGSHAAMRPTVRTKDGQFIDLEKNQELFIVALSN